MFYSITKKDGYIDGVAKGVSVENANSTEEEYTKVTECLKDMPTAPEGYYCRLTENLEWVLCEKPIVDYKPLKDETATEADYLSALEKLGVGFNA